MFGSKEGHSTRTRENGGIFAWLVGGLAGMAVFLLIVLSSGWAQSGVNTASVLPLPARPSGTHSKPPPSSTPSATDTPSAPSSAPTTLPEGPVPPTGSVAFPQPSQSQPEPTRTHRPRPTPAPHPSSPDVRIPKSAVQQYARSLIGSDAEFACMAHIIDHESGWDPHAGNADGSYGVPQSLPGNKMASAGADWHDNPMTQVRWMVGYLHNRYGTACNAWGFWQNHSWY